MIGGLLLKHYWFCFIIHCFLSVLFQINDSQLNSSESGSGWVCLPIVLRALSIFRLLLFLLEYPAGVSAEERALERFQRDPAGYPNNNSNNRKIESARRTIGSDAKVRRRRSFRTAVWAKHVHTSNVAMLDLPPGPTDILCENFATLKHSWAARILNFALRRSNHFISFLF